MEEFRFYKVKINTVDKFIGNYEGYNLDLITFVTDSLSSVFAMQLILPNSGSNLVVSKVYSLKKKLRRL